jgi:hypothetical protein
LTDEPEPTPYPTRDRWVELIGTTFRVNAVDADGTDITVELALTEADGPAGHHFSLVFTGPADPILTQGTRRFVADEIEPLDIFVTPLGTDGTATRYEAVFNLRPPATA